MKFKYEGYKTVREKSRAILQDKRWKQFEGKKLFKVDGSVVAKASPVILQMRDDYDVHRIIISRSEHSGVVQIDIAVTKKAGEFSVEYFQDIVILGRIYENGKFHYEPRLPKAWEEWEVYEERLRKKCELQKQIEEIELPWFLSRSNPCG